MDRSFSSFQSDDTVDDTMDDADLPQSSCACAEYMEWGRHDPRNHLPPPPPGPQAPAHLAPSASTQVPASGPGSLPDPAALEREQTLLDGFREALAGEGRKATFTCGGSLPLVLRSGRTETGDLTPRTNAKVQEQKIVTKPPSIRFGDSDAGWIVEFPSDHDEAFDCLVEQCKPATFGRGGQDVYDEAYRKAGAMSVDEFVTDFCPYKTGIIDIVTQLLLPPIVGDLQPGAPRSVFAEQYALTADQERQLRIVFDSEAGQTQHANFQHANLDSMPVMRLSSLLARLDVPHTGKAEFRQILQSLDIAWHDLGSATLAFEDVRAIVIERLHAKRRAKHNAKGIRTPRPKVPKPMMMFRGLRAELYKLNVYTGPRGFFKPHVDTPRSQTQIGSLVVCLPQSHKGGALAVRHQGQEVVHDLSSKDDTAIHWAAFYSDCEHEVTKVTKGHRITLTYNLYLAPGTGLLAGNPLSLRPSRLPLFQQLKAALATQDFMPKGGYIGFMLAHSYPHTDSALHHFVPNMLKGSDMALYEAVHAAGLICALEPIDDNALPRENALQDLERLYRADLRTWPRPESHAPPSHLAATEIDFELNEDDEVEERDLLPDNYDSDTERYHAAEYEVMRQRVKARDGIVWIGGGGRAALSKAYLAYGNNAELKVKYTKLALLVKVLSWAERSRSGTREDPVTLE